MKTPSSLGFTLLEVLLALSILAASLLLLQNSQSSSFFRIKKTQDNFEVAVLLERKMAEIELKYRGKPLDQIPEEEEESFGEEYPQYSWKLESQKLEFPDLASMIPQTEGGSNNQEMMASLLKQMTEALSKSIKEARVTVIHAPKGGKKREFSATMYFVDYDQQIPMSMPVGGS